VSLSSTEAEYYAMTSTCIDTIYIKHILEFLLDCDVEAQVKVDNSATRQIANKLGTSKLRHVQGKLLWVQQQVKSGVLKLKQIPTMWNPADSGTKGLNKRRHNMLRYLFGFVDEQGEHVGSVEFYDEKLQEASRNAIKKVKLVLPSDSTQSSSGSQVAKQVLRVAMVEIVGALGQTVAVDDSSEPNAISEKSGGANSILNFQILKWVCFAGVMLAFMMALFFMVVDEDDEPGPEESPGARQRRYAFSSMSETSDPDYWMELHHAEMSDASNDPEVDEAGPQVNTPLQYGMFHMYLFMQGNFQRLRHLMQTDHAMQGRGYAVLTCMLKVLKSHELNGITAAQSEYMALLHRSINDMERVVLERGGSASAIQDGGQGQIYQDFADNLQLEPEGEEPTAEEVAEQGIRLWQGELPEPETRGSPESVAKWMIKRLTRRIVLGCVEGRPAMCRHMAMRETMRDVLRACSRSSYNRSRAMVMMHEVTDLSFHESSSSEAPDPFEYMVDGLPDGQRLWANVTLDSDDFEENDRRAHGPLDARGLVESSSTIPPYITINEHIYFTAEFDDLPEDSILVDHGADWDLFLHEQSGFRFRVRRWETNEESRRNPS